MRFLWTTLSVASSIAPSYVASARSLAVNASTASAFVVNSQGASRTLQSASRSSGSSSSDEGVVSSSSSNISSTTSNTAAAAEASHKDELLKYQIKMVDRLYPGTAVERMMNVRARVQEIADELHGDWSDVRRLLLWAGGLKNLPHSVPGQGYTGHAFNDYNHVDLTCMNDAVSDSENDGAIRGIAVGNRLGPGIRIASLEELGPGGR